MIGKISNRHTSTSKLSEHLPISHSYFSSLQKLQEVVQRVAGRTNQCSFSFCNMAVSINSIQLSLPQATIAAFFLVLGFLFFAFQIRELLRMLLSTFVTPGKPVRLIIHCTGVDAEFADAILAQDIRSTRILGFGNRRKRWNWQAICASAGKGWFQYRPCLTHRVEATKSLLRDHLLEFRYQNRNPGDGFFKEPGFRLREPCSDY